MKKVKYLENPPPKRRGRLILSKLLIFVTLSITIKMTCKDNFLLLKRVFIELNVKLNFTLGVLTKKYTS